MCSFRTLLQVVCISFIAKNCDCSPFGNNSFIRTSRQISGCVLPEHPKFGFWIIYQKSSQKSPGQIAPLGTVLQVKCNDNYKLDGDKTIVCIGGEWTNTVGQCLRTCPGIQSTSTRTVTCTYNERKLKTCTEPLDGTLAQFQCANFYEDQNLEIYPIYVCFNGNWSHNLPECVPICGRKSSKNNPTLLVGGKNATLGEYPWHVALYDITSKSFICGGSLISQRVILSAAHCVTDNKGKVRSKDLYEVAVGKYFRNYSDSRDFDGAQFSSIHEIYVPKHYKADSQHFFGDIAVLISKKSFVLSIRVQPVCIDWDFRYHRALLAPTKVTYGQVPGWGNTAETSDPAVVLKKLEVPLVNDSDCKLPEDDNIYLTADKLCAGFLNAGRSVCHGDSGGGLVTKFGNRFYIVGIVSLSPQAETPIGGCNSQQFALYTNISYYAHSFILDKEVRYGPSNTEVVNCEGDSDCKSTTTTTTTTTTTIRATTDTPRNGCLLPEHPPSGQWSVFGANSKFSPGMSVSSETILRISCKNGYKLDGSSFVLCEKGKWLSEIGQCLKTCPPLYGTNSTKITCTFKNKEMEDCSKPLEGTLVRHQCAPFYEDLQLSKNPVRLCWDGAWNLPVPECVPICGQKSIAVTTLIINGTTAKKGDYPWQVAIYRTKDKLLICGGTLISQRIVLTAAHCVTNHDDGALLPVEDYIIAAGKYYRNYNDSRDYEEAQFSELKAIYISEQYRSHLQNYVGDIAILVTQKTFVLSQRVQPVCLDVSNSYSQEISQFGLVTGWGYTTEGSKPSDVLKELTVSLISSAQCRENLPEDFEIFLTFDKMCAGYLNKSTSICRGDAGGGLVFKHGGRYYLGGITSLSPSSPLGGCDSQQYGLYTKITSYINFIIQKSAEINSGKI